jgi:hypothetical protein
VKGADLHRHRQPGCPMGYKGGARRHNLLKRYQVNARLMARAQA